MLYLTELRRRRQIIRNLHDTITRLTSLRALKTAAAPRVTGRLEPFSSFGSNPGGLGAKIYVPDSYSRGAPLIVVLHGCTQSADSYDLGAGWSNAADEHGFALLFPEQRRANNANLCFNWFLDEDAGRDRGEALSIRQMVAETESRFGSDPARVFVTGLSAGGAMAVVMLASYPEVFAGGGIIAGLPFGSAHSIPQAFDRMRGQGGPTGKALSNLVREASTHGGPWPTLSIWHGSGDMTVDPSNARDLIDQWGALHGISKSPTRADRIEGYPHRVWCDSSGREVVEEYSITGMAHGTPLDASDEDTGEVAGAFMLEAGISSTRQLLRFWDLAPDSAATVRMRPSTPHSIEPADSLLAQMRQAPTDSIGRTIEEALRSAGLLR